MLCTRKPTPTLGILSFPCPCEGDIPLRAIHGNPFALEAYAMRTQAKPSIGNPQFPLSM